MIDLGLSDTHVGILVELYWNGYQRSRTTPTIQEEIEYLINVELIEEFQLDLIWWGMVPHVKITEKGTDALMRESPLRVFDLLLNVAESSEGASRWVMKFALEQLPAAFACSDEQVREAAEVRLMELVGRVKLSENELQRLMICYRIVHERPKDWVPPRVLRRLLLLGFLRITPNGVGYSINLTDKGIKVLEDYHSAALIEFLVGCLDGGPDMPTLRDSHHVSRLIQLLRALPVDHLAELLVSENEFIRSHAVRRLGQTNGPWL